MPVNPIIYKCGRFHYVPLLGPWGGTGYSSLLVLRQACIEQFVPFYHGLEDCDFSYVLEGAGQRIRQIVEAWNDVRKIKNNTTSDSFTTEYATWRFKGTSQGRGKRKCTEASSSGSSLGISLPDKEREKMEKELEQWKSRAIEAEGDLKELRKVLKIQDHLQKSNIELDLENQDLDKKIKKLKGINDTLKAKAVKKDSTMQGIKDAIQALQHDMSELRTLLEARSQQLVNSENDNNTLRRVIEGLEHQIQRYQDASERIMAENRRLQEEHNNNEEMTATVEVLRQENANLQQRHETVQRQIDEAIDSLRRVTQRAREFADWGSEIRGSLAPFQTNEEQLSEFLAVLCRDLAFFSRFF